MAQISETKAEEVKCVALRVIHRKAAGGQQHVVKQLGSGTTAAQNEYGSRASGRLRTVVHQAVCLGRFQFRRHVLFFRPSSVRWAGKPEFHCTEPTWAMGSASSNAARLEYRRRKVFVFNHNFVLRNLG